MNSDEIRRALRHLAVSERVEILDGIDLPRSIKLGSAGQITSRARQRGLLEEVERALDDGSGGSPE